MPCVPAWKGEAMKRDVTDFALKTVQIMAWARARCKNHSQAVPCFCAEVAVMLGKKGASHVD